MDRDNKDKKKNTEPQNQCVGVLGSLPSRRGATMKVGNGKMAEDHQGDDRDYDGAMSCSSSSEEESAELDADEESRGGAVHEMIALAGGVAPEGSSTAASSTTSTTALNVAGKLWTENENEDHHGDRKQPNYQKLRREKRLAMNRATARARRRKKKDMLESLSNQVASLQKKNQVLEEDKRRLQERVQQLEDALVKQNEMTTTGTCSTSMMAAAAAAPAPHFAHQRHQTASAAIAARTAAAAAGTTNSTSSSVDGVLADVAGTAFSSPGGFLGRYQQISASSILQDCRIKPAAASLLLSEVMSLRRQQEASAAGAQEPAARATAAHSGAAFYRHQQRKQQDQAKEQQYDASTRLLVQALLREEGTAAIDPATLLAGPSSPARDARSAVNSITRGNNNVLSSSVPQVVSTRLKGPPLTTTSTRQYTDEGAPSSSLASSLLASRCGRMFPYHQGMHTANTGAALSSDDQQQRKEEGSSTTSTAAVFAGGVTPRGFEVDQRTVPTGGVSAGGDGDLLSLLLVLARNRAGLERQNRRKWW